MSAIGGHKRDKSESLPIAPILMPVRPKLTVLGSMTMSRQQHSMDSLYGDEEPKGFSEALRWVAQRFEMDPADENRLSNTLQATAAKDSGSVLTSGDGLSSRKYTFYWLSQYILTSNLALTFTFNFSPSTRKPGFPFPFPSFPRPASLLQRGRSFTSEDFPAEEETTPPKIRPEMQRSASSPVSVMTTSPPSSISSQSISEEFELEIEADPITPLNQTFPHSLLGLRDSSSTAGSSDGSGNTTPAGTPAITLTVDSPTRATPRLMATGMTTESTSSSTVDRAESPSPSLPFANLSLTTPFSLSFNPPTISTTGGRRRSLRPIALSRSLSETSTGSVRPLYEPLTSNRETKRPRFGPGSGLSVAVPRAHGGQWEELRSPFEIKSSAP